MTTQTTKNALKFAFTTDKNGKPIAFRESYCRLTRANYDEAKMMIATGQAIEVRYVKW